MNLVRNLRVAALLAFVPFVEPAVAGRACEAVPPTPIATAKGLDLADRTRRALDASGAEVALVARAGQDLSRWGLRWSHMAFAWRDHPAGRWTVVHELNECGASTSGLFVEGLGNFFLDDPWRYEALVVVPDATTQRRLATLLASSLPATLHEPRYNVVAYPYSTRYQNSNQWLLEVLAVAMADDPLVEDRDGAQAWLRLHAYRATTLDIPALTRLGADLFRANVAFDDHPFGERMAGRIDAVTVESVVGSVRARSPTSAITTIRLDPWLLPRSRGPSPTL